MKVLHIRVALEGGKKESLNLDLQVRGCHLDNAIVQDSLHVLDLEASRLFGRHRPEHSQVVIDPVRVDKFVAEVAEDAVTPKRWPSLLRSCRTKPRSGLTSASPCGERRNLAVHSHVEGRRGRNILAGSALLEPLQRVQRLKQLPADVRLVTDHLVQRGACWQPVPLSLTRLLLLHQLLQTPGLLA